MSLGHPRRELFAYVEGRLDPADRARLEQHLAACPACGAEAADLMQLGDTLSALPLALQGLADRGAGSWSTVWARVQAMPMRRLVPQLNLYLSLAVVVFVLATALRAGLGAPPVPVTAGAVQTAVTAQATPLAGKGAAPGAGQASTALAASRLATGARAIPNPTPVPGLKG